MSNDRAGRFTTKGDNSGQVRIAYLSNFFPSLTETFIYREVLELKRRGFEIATYSLRKPRASRISREASGLYRTTYYLLPASLVLVISSHLRWIFHHPVRYARTAWKMTTGTHLYGKDRIRSLMHFGEGVVLARKMMMDGIVHIHAHYASQAASVARVVHLLTQIPYSFTGHAHDIWQDRLLLPEKLEEATFAVTCSQTGKDALCREGYGAAFSKISVVYHGLETNSFPFCDDITQREKNLILSVGRLTAQKGFPDLIDACALLKAAGFPFRCMIVGEGEERNRLEEIIASRSLSGEVSLVGAVSQEQITDIYRKASVFALPCVDTEDGNRDGIPNVLMEAMAVGVPVITTDNSGQRELIEDGRDGFIVPVHSPERLAKAVIRLCDDPTLHDTIAGQARKRIEEAFDSRKTIEPLIELFRLFVFRGTGNVSAHGRPSSAEVGQHETHSVERATT